VLSGNHPDSLLSRARILLGALILLMFSFYVVGNIPVTIITGVFVILFGFKFRDPHREIPSDPLAVVSPVDGQVVLLERVSQPGPGGEAIRIVINVAAFGAYVFRSPTEGKLIEMPAFPAPRSRRLRGLNIQTDENDHVSFLLHGPWIAPPCSSKQLGERVGQGERCGVLRLAGRAEVLLPVTAQVQCKAGEHLRSGESILGHFVAVYI